MSWLSLHEAAQHLGVHPTTLRRWADEGAIPVMLTAGGHRRFAVADLDAFIETQRQALPAVSPAQLWAERAMAETRKEIVAHQDAAWVAALSVEERESSRQLGRRLMGLMLQYIALDPTAPERDDVLDEAQAIGRTYAESARQRGMPLTEALRAMFFFRDTLLETAISLDTPKPRPEASIRLLRRINDLLNAVQLSVAEVYERDE